ncbi:MAG: ABC transporter permease, partial [Calditrichaeota bacterium]
MFRWQIFSDMVAISRRILWEWKRTRRMLIFWLVFPTLMLLLFGLIYAGGKGTARSFDATAPGILIGAALFFSCLGGPTTILIAERERHTLRRLLISPLHPAGYFLGILLAHLYIAFIQTLIVYGIAYLFGGRFHGAIWLGGLIVFLSVAAYVGLGFFFGARLARRTEDATGPIAAVGVPLLVLGGTFFPLSILPDYLLTIAYLDPVLHMNEALRAVSASGAG